MDRIIISIPFDVFQNAVNEDIQNEAFYRYVPCGLCVVIIQKTINCINNEDRKGIMNKNNALYRGTEFVVKGIMRKQGNDTILLDSFNYEDMEYITGRVIKAKKFDFNLENEDTDGIKYYLSYNSAFFSNEDNLVKMKYSGNYLKFYSNGAVREIYNLKNGIRHGITNILFPFNFSQKNQQIKLECTYDDGLKEGKETIYFNNGVVRACNNYYHNELDGAIIEYWRNKKCKFLKDYFRGKLSGRYYECFKDGSCRIVGSMSNNEKFGVWTYLSKFGCIIKKGKYFNSKMVGGWFEYYGENIIKGKGIYKEDYCEEYFEYFMNGTLKSKGKKHNDVKIGKWNDYNRLGYVWREIYYSKTGKIKNTIKLGPVG